jgi:hypothetical protein
MADHNDPNSVNSAFSDIDVSAADLYDFFGFPTNSDAGAEKVYMALTFASVPGTGVFDSDILYRLQIHAAPRAAWPEAEGRGIESLLKYVDAVKENSRERGCSAKSYCQVPQFPSGRQLFHNH